MTTKRRQSIIDVEHCARIDDEISATALAAHQQAARSRPPASSSSSSSASGLAGHHHGHDKRRGDTNIDSADDSSDHDDDHLILVDGGPTTTPPAATSICRSRTPHGRRAPRPFSSHAASTLTVHVAAEDEEESPGSPSSSVSLDDVGSAGGRTPTGAYVTSSSASSAYDKSTRRVQRKSSHPYRSIFLGDQLFSWDFHSVAVRNDAAMLGHYNADLSPSAASPVCASCHSDRSPYWHKEHTNALHLLMCNACGIRYKKYRTHCPGASMCCAVRNSISPRALDAADPSRIHEAPHAWPSAWPMPPWPLISSFNLFPALCLPIPFFSFLALVVSLFSFCELGALCLHGSLSFLHLFSFVFLLCVLLLTLECMLCVL